MAIEPSDDEPLFPPAFDDLDEGLAAAETAWAQPDPALALQLWAALRSRFPQEPAPYLRAAEALAELSRFDEEEALVLEGRRKFPDNPEFAIARARLMRQNGEPAAAAALFAAFRKSAPDHPAGYVEGALCLRDLEQFDAADALLKEAMARLPPDADLAVNHAWVAHHRGDWPEALRRWRDALAEFPDDPSPPLGMGDALRELGRFADADAVLAPAVERFPGHADILVNYARVAQQADDAPEALRRWQLVCAAMPDDAEAQIAQAAALRALGYDAEAEGVLAEAAARDPADTALLREYARAAQDRGEWPEALDRWERVRAQDGDDPAGTIGVAVALRELGRFDEADALLEEAMARAPGDADIAVNHAWVADYRGDWLEAVRRWEIVRRQFPDDASPHFGIGAALRELGRFDEADRVFVAAIERFPGHLDVLVNYARVATSRGDRAEALRRWEVVHREFPDDPSAQEAVALGLAAVDAEPEDFAAASPAPAQAEPPDPPAQAQASPAPARAEPPDPPAPRRDVLGPHRATGLPPAAPPLPPLDETPEALRDGEEPSPLNRFVRNISRVVSRRQP